MRSNVRRLSSVPPPKRKERIHAKDVCRGDEIMVGAETYSEVTKVEPGPPVKIWTEGGGFARMDPEQPVAVRR